jgi:hypothetical protein
MTQKYLDSPCPDCGNLTVPPYEYDPENRRALLHTPPCDTCDRQARVTICELSTPDAQGRTHVYSLAHNGRRGAGGKVTIYLDADNLEFLKSLPQGAKSPTVNLALGRFRKEIGA